LLQKAPGTTEVTVESKIPEKHTASASASESNKQQRKQKTSGPRAQDPKHTIEKKQQEKEVRR
jgi:hypothetical protein